MDGSIILQLIVVLAVISIAWWAFRQIDLPPPVRTIAVVILAVVLIAWLLSLVGGFPGLTFHRALR